MGIFTQGPFHAGTAASVAGAGTAVWNVPSNIVGGAGFTTSNIDTTSGVTLSDFLYGTNYGFTIPLVATISSITLEIFESNSGVISISDNSVKMLKAGAPVGIEVRNGVWPLPGAYVSYNGMAGWSPTPADVNNVGFGAYVQALNNDMSHIRVASVKDIRITVVYQVPTGFIGVNEVDV